MGTFLAARRILESLQHNIRIKPKISPQCHKNLLMPKTSTVKKFVVSFAVMADNPPDVAPDITMQRPPAPPIERFA